MNNTEMQERGVEYIYCAYIVRKDGTIVYPKNAKCFRFRVNRK